MVVPYEHQSSLAALEPEIAHELMDLTQRTERALGRVYQSGWLQYGAESGQGRGGGRDRASASACAAALGRGYELYDRDFGDAGVAGGFAGDLAAASRGVCSGGPGGIMAGHDSTEMFCRQTASKHVRAWAERVDNKGVCDFPCSGSCRTLRALVNLSLRELPDGNEYQRKTRYRAASKPGADKQAEEHAGEPAYLSGKRAATGTRGRAPDRREPLVTAASAGAEYRKRLGQEASGVGARTARDRIVHEGAVGTRCPRRADRSNGYTSGSGEVSSLSE